MDLSMTKMIEFFCINFLFNPKDNGMGIPFFQIIVTRRFAQVILHRVPQYVSSLNLDFNSIIHACAALVYAYGDAATDERRAYVATADPKALELELFEAVLQTVFNLISHIQPREVLTIAIDGTAPLAKIQQQRQRRYRAALEGRSGQIFDSNSITPGTDFMQRLDAFLRQRLVANQFLMPPKVIYSSHLVPGEGEGKIVDLIRAGEIIGDGAHIFYGLDADLFMLAMISPINNIFLVREDITDVVQIDNLKTALQDRLGTETAVRDFVFMMFLVGNDFLPHSPSFGEILFAVDTMIECYRRASQPLTRQRDDGSYELNWPGILAFFQQLALMEPELLEREAGRQVTYPSHLLQESITMIQQPDGPTLRQLNYDMFRGAWYTNALGPHGETQILEQLTGGPVFDVTTDRIVEMIENYFTGLAWVFSYYTNGLASVNVNYNYRYQHSPLFRDMASVLEQLLATGSMEITTAEYLATPEQVAFNPVHQLLAVLPPKSRHLLPKEVRFLMDPDSPILDLFPLTFTIDREGTNYDWQGITILPPVEASRIIEAVAPVPFAPKRANAYASAETLIITKNTDIEKLLQDKQRALEKIRLMTRGRGRGSGSPRGYQGPPSGYQGPPRGYQGPPRGYQGPPRGYQGPPSGYQGPSEVPTQASRGRGFERGRGRGFDRGRSRGRGVNRGRGARDNLNIPVRPTQEEMAVGESVVEIPPRPPDYRFPTRQELPRPGTDQPHLYSRNGRGGTWSGTRGGLGSGLRPPTLNEFAVPPAPHPTAPPAPTPQEAWRAKALLM
jgi:hypothetical protein